jgi:hypothetical protein
MNQTSESSQISAPKWFLILSIVLAIWNLLDVMAFFMQINMTPEQTAVLEPAEQQLYLNIPLWVNIAFGCAVFGGVLGCIALDLKKSIALPILLISLAGILVQTYYSFCIANLMAVLGPNAAIMPSMVVVVALFLLWLANRAKTKGWIS